MASCLYECLCEAELEKYYSHFAAFGLQKIDELAQVSMEDYAKLGVHDINDRKRLFQLIRIIKIMREEGIADLSKQDLKPRGLFIQPQVTRSGPRRQLRFESFCEEDDGTVRESESEVYHSPDFSANEEKNSVGEMLGHILPHDSEPIRLTRRDLNIAGIGTKNDLSCPAVSDDIAPLLGDSEAPIVQRITHISGYNYGLPHSCVRSNTFDKETPWTEREKIRVCVRKRPLCQREERRGEVNIITVKDKETLLLHEKKEAVDLTQYILQHVFYFDEVFGESCTNHDVYMRTAYPLIQHIFSGGNATCFAYGQTGAGKTYTMIGNHRNPGLYALAAKDIFRHLETSPSRKDLLVLISFYEIYCGQLYDLLNERKRLFAREDGNHVVQIVGLREIQVDCVDHLLEVILKGGKERSTGATGVNSDSSRSHAIIQIQIKDTANRACGRISFIDLAGSERAADARDSDRQTKMEGAEINQSLLALKECIRALDQEHTHTPFRQSKLTQVLKDSFIGNSKTCMIANISPSHIATEHTLNTLRYADRVKELKKGIRCSTPITKRRRRARNISPKRIQSTPSLPPGEKSSPKKVKLGLQHPSGVTKPKAYLTALQPHGVPLTSTPKGIGKGHGYKGNTSTPCFHHTTPVKGVLRITHPLKKKNDDLSPHSEKSPSMKDFIASAETKESDQHDKYMQNRTPVQCLKVQTVQPVQKQLAPRDDGSFGDGSLPSDSEQEWGNTFAKQSVEPWAYLPPFQKEREEHLRLYHQQFQQPPILKQKLNYQPLERFLMQYKPEEIQVKQELSLSPTEVQNKEGMQLEDLDDSDFSEDSFSPVCSQKSVKRGSTNKCSQHSFFLHEREEGTEEEQKGQKRQDLFFKYAIAMQDHGLDCSEGNPKAEESIKNAGCSDTPADWSYDLDVESSPSNTAEKPYCLQEDPACSWRNGKDFLSDHKEYKSKPRCLVYSSEATSVSEKDASNLYISPVLKSGPPECKEIDLQHDEKEESLLDKKAALAGGVKWKARKNVVSHSVSSSCSSEFTSELMAPLLLSPLDGEDTTKTEKASSSQEKPPREKQVLDSGAQSRFEEEGWQCTRSRSLTDSMLELGEQPRHGGRLCALLGSPQASPKRLLHACGRVKPCCCRLGSASSKQGVRRSLFGGHGPMEASAAASTAGSTTGYSVPRLERESGGLCSDSPCREHSGGRRCGADVNQHNNAGNSGKSNSSQGHPAEEINAEIPEKSYAAQSPSRENSLLLQTKPGLRNEDLTHSEDPSKSLFSDEETGLLKTKLKQSIFAQDTFAADAGFATIDNKPIANAKCPSHMSSSSSPSPASEMEKWQREALEKAQQIVIRAHQQQLDEMACLCFKEECLINQMSAMDFQNFMTMLDEILVLKLKCVQAMRAQLQLCLSSPGTDTSLQTSPPV
ncbi:PREDICTED: kinesin-like protein KIF24 isoform X1 [Ficedula albicollis]|uniref:Kinesin-like protein KIF24 n=1 Tax=Ficedula albicollis TaxID=59894 RepID=A0A803W994_FICAL|nr:PREDICTED: kinesin-like protein KIF24 isoform X1 [Ficedula albicollis]XP_005060464.1 PREDICTED: kinesin-like protein KIF24 isoform X1 [Ficedula albicollis]XP_016160358.1 PREDICTED: kinesin-like protein KIF24 isoform X1 [Ficedula albicollis]XP_016160359.1 PREDICTED: kinesin-like protein KIF24 isoform X1 [Ficedula albicollis]